MYFQGLAISFRPVLKQNPGKVTPPGDDYPGVPPRLNYWIGWHLRLLTARTNFCPASVGSRLSPPPLANAASSRESGPIPRFTRHSYLAWPIWAVAVTLY